MKKNSISFFKKIFPVCVTNKIREYRRERRFSKRFSYNNGEAFFKNIKTQGVVFDILINPFLNAGVDDVIAETGVWEPKLSSNLKKYLQKDGVFLDIGANIGYHSLFAAEILKDGGNVYSFEPQPLVYKQFLQSVERNKLTNITVFNTALSDHEGEESLYIREENIGGSTLVSPREMKDFDVQESFHVPLVTLDSFVEVFTNVDVIKIDVEGYEYEVFKGGETILEKYHPVIFMEFSPIFYMQDYTEKAQEFVEFLETKGYTFFTLEETPIDLYEWMKRDDNMHKQIDVMCRVV